MGAGLGVSLRRSSWCAVTKARAKRQGAIFSRKTRLSIAKHKPQKAGSEGALGASTPGATAPSSDSKSKLFAGGLIDVDNDDDGDGQGGHAHHLYRHQSGPLAANAHNHAHKASKTVAGWLGS